MDSSLYKAAREGNIDVLIQNKHQLDIQVTPNKNTALHVAALFGNTQSVIEILNMCPSIQCHVNSKAETALHIAVREGHSDIVRALIEYAKALGEELENGVGTAKEMLRMTNEVKDTALHEAVRNHRPDVAVLLIQEDPEFSHPANNAEETPLYLAAERGYVGLVSEILQTCRSPADGGPYGRTALHVAVICNFEGCTKRLLDWKPALAKEADIFGWTPLHYAARFGNVLMVRQLLNVDHSVAYLADKDDRKTPLHIAASRGHSDAMKELISQCPDCWEMVDGKGQNILHIAVENERDNVIRFILQNFSLSSLINQKDANGNSPLHLLAASDWYEPNLIMHPRADKMAVNKENLNPLDVIYSDKYIESWGFNKRDLKSAGATLGPRNVITRDKDEMKMKEKYRVHEKFLPVDIKRTADTWLIVAALIATVTFAAGFTVPGGYDGNGGPDQGMAVLTRKAAFKAFVIFDTIAMMFSACAVFIHFIAADDANKHKLIKHYTSAYCLTIIAMGAMVVAFMTGLYTVLAHSPGLAISLCIISCSSFPIYSLLLKKAWRDSKTS